MVSRELMSYRAVKMKIMTWVCVARCVKGRAKETERAVSYSYYMRDNVTSRNGVLMGFGLEPCVQLILL